VVAAFGSLCCVRLVLLACALLLTWLSSHKCSAQQAAPAAALKLSFAIDARSTARTELANFNAQREASAVGVDRKLPSPWLVAAASTTAAFAASYAVLGGFSYKASNQAARSLERSRDFNLDFDTRLRMSEHASNAQSRADLLSRVSDICVAGAVASAGATLLIWLSSKSKRQEQQVRTLIGPMVLRGGGSHGGGLVARAKF
jgi:hypothetical protein